MNIKYHSLFGLILIVSLMHTPFLSAAVQDELIGTSLIGSWVGEIDMIDHSHPLVLEIADDGYGQFKVNYTFWDMTFADYNLDNVKKSMLSLTDSEVEIVLKEAGIKITASLTETPEMVGTVYWMGLEQPIVLKKTTKSRQEQESGMSNTEELNVAILIFDGVDALDWAGPLEVFDYAHVFNTYTVAAQKKLYNGGAYQINPNYTYDDMPKPDVLVIPGGEIGHLFLDEITTQWIKKTSENSRHVLSVCNASLILAANDMLKNLNATTHDAWSQWLEKLSKEYHFNALETGRFQDNGKIITSGGVSAGIDAALHLVAKLKGVEHAKMTAQMMNYQWVPEIEYDKK